MKGIILAGGTGSRLFPMTFGLSKQLLPVYDKPLIYYPLSVLMLANIREVMIIIRRSELANFCAILGDGSHLGISITYGFQEEPNGIAEAFIIGESFINNQSSALVLGDNIFFGAGFVDKLVEAGEINDGARVFGQQVSDPERFGVAEFDDNLRVTSLEEKPAKPKSSWAVTGLYFYDSEIVDIAKNLQPSGRGELEITDANLHYLQQGKLHISPLGRGTAWLDTGTYDSLLDAAQFVHTIEKRQGLKIACLEEISFLKGWINAEKLHQVAQRYKGSPYFRYLINLIQL